MTAKFSRRPVVLFHVPVRPYSPIDALNRRALATGSLRYAAAGANADYNGHAVVVAFNSYRGYYTAEYTWAGRVVLARGSFAECLRAALCEQARGALGASVDVELPEGDAEALALCEAEPLLVRGAQPDRADWYTWRHSCAAASARDAACPHLTVMRFDWELMQAAEDQPAYEAALRAKYGRVYT